MKSYSEREIFTPEMLSVWRDATKMIELLGMPAQASWSCDLNSLEHRSSRREIRCHELARAVAIVLGDRLSPHIIDEQLDAIEHSWLLLTDKTHRVLLDVYTPGRMPQVQLVDCHWAVCKQYKKGELRNDIDFKTVDRLVEELRNGGR